MKNYKNPELVHAYTIILFLALLFHGLFTVVFFVTHLPYLALYNVVIVCFYAVLLVMIHREFYCITVALTHIEVCTFVIISTICMGWGYWFFVYLIAIASLSYFNPYKNKKLIYIFPVLELIIFFILRLITLSIPPLITTDKSTESVFFFINCTCCFVIIAIGTLVSQITLDEVKRIRDRMLYDGLTGVYSREYFKEKVEHILHDTPETDYYLILTNIIGFKYFNELFGKEKGDELLIAHADVLKELSGKIIVYGRISGSEFGILVKKSDFREDILKTLIMKIQEKFTTDLYWLHILGGIYSIENHDESVDTMLDKAKMTIDFIKEEYNSYFAYYDNKILDKSLNEKKLLGEFERALENDEFCFFLQPQMTQQNMCFGAEALVRWQHPQRGLIYPDDFITVLENTGLIWKLDIYIWEQVVKKLSEWRQCNNSNMYISINISPRDFYYLDIYKFLTSLVEKYQVSPNQLKLEITETAIMIDVEKQVALLSKLREYGFEVEIDDFGSGYSSLNTLKDIHADVLKIDRVFLRDASCNERSWSILSSIVELSKSIGMRTITEGVETQEQLKALQGIGCDMFQGYYFSKPVTVDTFEKEYL